jgi:hypothetical protein
MKTFMISLLAVTALSAVLFASYSDSGLAALCSSLGSVCLVGP